MTATLEAIKRLHDEQRTIWERDGKPLADIAAERALTAEEQETWERLNASLSESESRMLVLTRQNEFTEQARNVLGLDAPTESRAAEIRNVLIGDARSLDFVPTAEEVRALSVGTATAGGNTVGKTYLQVLIQSLRQFSGVAAAGAYVLVTEKGDTVTVPRLSSFGAAAAQTENTQLTGTDPTFNQVVFNAYKYGDYRGISRELIDDSLVDIESIISQLIADNIAVLAGTKFAVGVGTTEPTGIATAATTGVTGSTAVAGAFTWDNLIDLQESVLAPYQQNASWVASNAAITAARKLKDSNGRYFWEPNGQSGAPGLLLGSPVFRDPFVASPGLSAKPIFYGDFSKYWIRTVGSTRVERSDQALFGADQIAFRGVSRIDGQLVDASAVKAFVGGAS